MRAATALILLQLVLQPFSSLSLSLPPSLSLYFYISVAPPLTQSVSSAMARGRKNMIVVGGVVVGTLAALVPVVVLPLFQQDSYGTLFSADRLFIEWLRGPSREGAGG